VLYIYTKMSRFATSSPRRVAQRPGALHGKKNTLPPTRRSPHSTLSKKSVSPDSPETADASHASERRRDPATRDPRARRAWPGGGLRLARGGPVPVWRGENVELMCGREEDARAEGFGEAHRPPLLLKYGPDHLYPF